MRSNRTLTDYDIPYATLVLGPPLSSILFENMDVVEFIIIINIL